MLCHTKPLCHVLLFKHGQVNSYYLIPYIWQLIFAYISDKGWVINSDEDGFFDGSCQIMIFSVHYAKVVDGYIMTSVIMMVMDEQRGFHVFFISFSKCSARLPNVFIFTVHSTTLVSVYHPTFTRWYLCSWV